MNLKRFSPSESSTRGICHRRSFESAILSGSGGRKADHVDGQASHGRSVSIENLTGLNILVVSPNEWGDMRLSKHHYAETLARRGNRVFFLNPPDARARKRFEVEDVEGIPNLSTVTYRPFVPYSLRFRSRRLFDAIAHWHVTWLLKQIGVRFDVVWCFDVNLVQRSTLVRGAAQDLSSRGSSAAALSDQCRETRRLGLLGLQRDPRQVARFSARRSSELNTASARPSSSSQSVACAWRTTLSNRPLKVGYVGNLLMPSIDREAMLGLIERIRRYRIPSVGTANAEGKQCRRRTRECVVHTPIGTQ